MKWEGVGLERTSTDNSQFLIIMHDNDCFSLAMLEDGTFLRTYVQNHGEGRAIEKEGERELALLKIFR